MRLGRVREERPEYSKPDLRQTLEHYEITVHGNRGMVSCPWHSDSTPSMSVDLNKQLWHCHSCDRGGSSWDLIMEMEGGLSFDDARGFVARTSLGPAEEVVADRSRHVPRFAGSRSGAVASRSKKGADKGAGGFKPRWSGA